jgi:hypothetical protein
VAYVINKGSCKSADSGCLPVLAALFDLAERNKLYILADWSSRELNWLMGDVSANIAGTLCYLRRHCIEQYLPWLHGVSRKSEFNPNPNRVLFFIKTSA